MASHLFGAKPVSEPLLVYCQLDPREHISVKFYLNIKGFHAFENGICTMVAILPWPWSIQVCCWNLIWKVCISYLKLVQPPQPCNIHDVVAAGLQLLNAPFVYEYKYFIASLFMLPGEWKCPFTKQTTYYCTGFVTSVITNVNLQWGLLKLGWLSSL